ncbi:amino acid transporter AVT1H-like [Salvia splendens]|uniref:amino acid transporter AVT1H-like n=1 Tax=Salvia splendens TaxID=180675 RepID=UPI001C25438B|nr:amino acid transporter AVT1H-like [Salvia splendens]
MAVPGLGQLSTPYALENGGRASAFLLVGIGSVCAYTSCLLGKCMHKNPKSRDYKDIGYDAFGSKGRIIATTFIYLEIFMALVPYTISLHDNLANVFTAFTLSSSHLSASQLLALIAVLVALPSLWLRDLSSISFLSSAGVLSLLIFTSVAYTAVSGAIRALLIYIPVLHLSKIPAISGLYVFSFAGHIVFPNLYNSINDPSKFTKCCHAARAKPPPIVQIQNEDDHTGGSGLDSTAHHTRASTLRAILRARPQPHGLPSQCRNLYNFSMCFLFQDILETDFDTSAAA